MKDARVETFIVALRPRVDLGCDIRRKLEDITHNCQAAFSLAGPFMERREELEKLPPDLQLGLVDVLREALELRLKCVKLLALDRIENLPVAKIDEEWERLCNSISFVCLQLDPDARERVDAVL